LSQSPTNPTDLSTANRRWSRILPGEHRAVALAVTWLFFILLGYFVVRPVRETMGSIVGTRQLQFLFLASFAVMLAAVPLYAALVARLPRRWLVRVVYHLFAACLLGFWLLMRIDVPWVQTWTARILFVWISVFGLFATSVFWSVLADLFSSNQGKRLFGLIAAGGTAGAITGSLVTSQLAGHLSTGTLLLLPMAVIELGLWCAWRLERQSVALWKADPNRRDSAEDTGDRPTGGGLLSGITHVLRSPYLASICIFLFFVQACGTQLYFEQAEIVNAEIAREGSRTQLFAYIDLGTQVLTLLVQVCLSGVILRRLGVSVALVTLPLVYMAGFATLAAHQSLPVLAVTVIAARAAGYGVTVPAREVLFTVVSREDKYKSKSFIDTVVLRGGDALSGQLFGSLRGLGLSLTVMNLWALPVTGLWAIVAWRLGRRQRQLAGQPSGVASSKPGVLLRKRRNRCDD
jgi:AAA family ATP:ADP antiporter